MSEYRKKYWILDRRNTKIRPFSTTTDSHMIVSWLLSANYNVAVAVAASLPYFPYSITLVLARYTHIGLTIRIHSGCIYIIHAYGRDTYMPYTIHLNATVEPIYSRRLGMRMDSVACILSKVLVVDIGSALCKRKTVSSVYARGCKTERCKTWT